MTTTDKQTLPAPFHGFEGPNYTQVPDALFDELLAFLPGAELKVLLYIIRRTFGFKRHSDTISLSQLQNGITTREGKVLDHGTGLSKPALLKALRSLQDKQIIFTERRRSLEQGDQPTVYWLNVREDTPGKQMRPPLVKKVDHGGGQEISPRPWSQNFTTQETGEQETVEQDFDLSNIRKASPRGSGGKRGAKDYETAPPPTGDDSSQGMESIGSVLTRQGRGAPRSSSRPRPETETTEYQRIQALIADRAREFTDSASLKSSTTRAWNLFQAADVPIDVFESKIFQARALTQEATSRITKTVDDPTHHVRRKSKMAYFFATLEDQLNRRAGGDSAAAEEGGSGAGAPPRRSRAKQAKPDQPSSSSARRPDREGPYGAWIKS